MQHTGPNETVTATMPLIRWLPYQRCLLSIQALLVMCALSSDANAQRPAHRSEEEVRSEMMQLREHLRAPASAKAAKSCGSRSRYEGNLLVLDSNGRSQVFHDRIAIDMSQLFAEAVLHLIEGCDNNLNLILINQFRSNGREAERNRPSGEFWLETILVDMTGRYGAYQLRWLGTPIASPDKNAIASCEFGLMVDAYHGIHIAVRDEKQGWRKLWHHLPNDMLDCKFLRWEGPSRFRVLMHDQVLGGGNHWESVIEFTPTSLTRTDGPKTPTKPTP